MRTMINSVFSIIAFLFISISMSFAGQISEQELDARLDLARQTANAGKFNEAINQYISIFQQGSGWGMTELSQIYSNHMKDYKKAAMWCEAATELVYPQDFSCQSGYDGKFSESELIGIQRLAIQCIATSYKACDKLESGHEKKLDLYYAKYCEVNDPTGSKLNVRSKPSNGEVLIQFENGKSLVISDIVKDKNKKEWALVSSPETASEFGWVFKSYLKCNTRQRL